MALKPTPPMAAVAAGVLAAVVPAAMPAAAAPLDLNALWDFGRPEVSEARFRAALASATANDALVLRTQIARSFGLRGQFEQARTELAHVVPHLGGAAPEARVRYRLELGRSWVSATHPDAALTAAARAQAHEAFTTAAAEAKAAGLDALAIDALHMMAFVDSAPADQLRWNTEALAVAERSTQPAAKAWEASLRNNTGMALRDLRRFDEALAEFQRALALREARGQRGPTHVAHWMVARTLRDLGRLGEALAIQQRLEREGDAAGDPDAYVFEELEALYRALGRTEEAERAKGSLQRLRR